jgi:hypothetical protein
VWLSHTSLIQNVLCHEQQGRLSPPGYRRRQRRTKLPAGIHKAVNALVPAEGRAGQISGHGVGWHGQTRLPVESRRSRRGRNSTVKPVWRCHPTPEYLHTHVATGRRVGAWERRSVGAFAEEPHHASSICENRRNLRMNQRPSAFLCGFLCSLSSGPLWQ